jgi:hypothetical protein
MPDGIPNQKITTDPEDPTKVVWEDIPGTEIPASVVEVVPEEAPKPRRKRVQKGTAVALITEEVQHSMMIRTIPISSGDGVVPSIEQIESSVIERAQNLTQGLFALAADLAYLKAIGRHSDLGYEKSNQGFVHYLDDKIKLSYRAVMDYIRAYEAALRGGVSPEQFNAMGAEKVRQLPNVPQDKAKALADFATTPDQEGHLPGGKETKAKAQELAGYEPVIHERISFGWTKEKYDVVYGLLTQAAEIYQTKGNLAQALYIIATKWSQSTDNVSIDLGDQLDFLRELFPAFEITVTKKDE